MRTAWELGENVVELSENGVRIRREWRENYVRTVWELGENGVRIR